VPVKGDSPKPQEDGSDLRKRSKPQIRGSNKRRINHSFCRINKLFFSWLQDVFKERGNFNSLENYLAQCVFLNFILCARQAFLLKANTGEKWTFPRASRIKSIWKYSC
jgi:hypothetical protein